MTRDEIGKMRRGDRVRLNAAGVNLHRDCVPERYRNLVGTVIRVRTNGGVTLHWDGYKGTSQYGGTYLECVTADAEGGK